MLLLFITLLLLSFAAGYGVREVVSRGRRVQWREKYGRLRFRAASLGDAKQARPEIPRPIGQQGRGNKVDHQADARDAA